MKDSAPKNGCFYAVCPKHQWEGMQRESHEEARADLDGHLGWYPEESHAGSGVVSC